MTGDALSWRELSKLFTAVLCIDDEGRVVYASDLIREYLTDELLGGELFRVFEFQRPRAVRDMSALRDHLGALFLMKARDGSFAARGQFVEATWEGGPVICFCGAPWLFWMTENRPDVKLGMSDFSAQDSQLDQLFLMSAEQRMVADLEKLNADLQQAKRETERAQEAKDAFFAHMSHEMRTPLNGVVSALALLADEPLDESAERLLSLAQRSSRNLLQVINYILDVSKIESAGGRLDEDPINLPRLMQAVTDIVRARAEERGLNLHWHRAEGVGEGFIGDKSKLRQCLLNLVTNAIKFTRAGIVVVRALPGAENDGGTVRFEIEDTGIGISPEDQQRIFEPFWTSGGLNAGADGSTGLGLDIVRRNVEIMGGELGLISEPGKGSVFWFEIPLQASDEAAEHSNDNTPKDVEVPRRFAGDVLLVDDNSTNMTLGRMILESLGVTVDEASDGAEAVHKATTRPYDLVLMDINMPVMDGVEATRRIRLSLDDEALPIVALSAYASSEEQQRCAEAGMNDYLTKPIVRERLGEQLNRWLRPSESTEQTAQQQNDGNDATVMAPALDEEVLAQLRKQIGDENVSVVLDQFEAEVNDRWHSAEQCFQAGDREQLIREIHTLSSTCRSLGLTDAGEYFQAMEASLRDSDSGPEDLPGARSRLDRGLDALAGYRARPA